MNQEYIKLRSIMREEMGLIRTSKLTIKADDGVHKVANKIAAYAYKNSEEPTEKEVKSALSAKLIKQEFKNIERVEDDYTRERVVAFHGTNEKFPKEREDGKRFIFKANQGKNNVLILVDPSIPWAKHNVGMVYKGYKDVVEGIYKVYYFRLDKLIGHDLVSRLLMDDYHASALPSETIADAQKFASEYQKLTDYNYGQRKYSYYTQYDKTLIEVGHDLVNQNFDLIREKGWEVTLEKAEEYRWLDLETKTHKKEMFPSNYRVMKYNENTKTVEHVAVYPHRILATYERNNEFERMSYMKFFDETLRYMYRDEMNVQAMEKYAKERSHDVASAWETKKNIPEATLKAMETTVFNEDFRFVEFDERVNLTLLPRLEAEWKTFRNVLPQAEVKPDLRFRLLGHHRAAGIFVPLANSIGIDPREERIATDGEVIKVNGMSSLAHEYAHYLDYNFDKGDYPLSLRNGFTTILEQYQKKLDDLPANHPFKMTSSKYGLDYFKTPTEVFARSFELYISGFDNVKSAFVQDGAEFTRTEYQAFNGLEESIQEYFNERFPEMDRALKAFQIDESTLYQETEVMAKTLDSFVEVSNDAYISVDLFDSKDVANIRGTQMSLDL